MKDIKIKKIKSNKIPEKQEKEIEYPISDLDIGSKKSYSKFSVILFGFMSSSILLYIFMISSSIFYAVQMSQFTFKTENISYNDSVSISTSTVIGDLNDKKDSDRISYINKDLDTSITLK